MSEKNYHQNLIQTFCDNLSYFNKYFSFEIYRVKTNVQFHPLTEIDIILFGKNKKALIEVKSNRNGMGKFLQKQFQHYRSYDKKASIYLLFGNESESLSLEDITLQRYHPADIK